ncbi:hypothetical protein AAMO2058_000918600 [Amorphochlora amoebiformis]
MAVGVVTPVLSLLTIASLYLPKTSNRVLRLKGVLRFRGVPSGGYRRWGGETSMGAARRGGMELRGGGEKKGGKKWNLTRAVHELQGARGPDEILSALSRHGYGSTYKMSHLSQGLLRISKFFIPLSAAKDRRKLVRECRYLHAWEHVRKILESDAATNAQMATDLLLSMALLMDDSGMLEDTEALLDTARRLSRISDDEIRDLDGVNLSNLVWACRILGIDPPALALERESLLPFRLHLQAFPELDIEEIRREVQFKTDEVKLGGKVIRERRETAWQTSSNVPFRYSGKEMAPAAMTPIIQMVRNKIYNLTGVYYDCALINLYPDSSSGMRFHSDPDQGGIWSHNTAVVSVGDTRLFILRETWKHEKRHHFYVRSGDVMEMVRDCQEKYQHAIRTEESHKFTREYIMAVETSEFKPSKYTYGPRVSIVFKQSLETLEKLAEI